MLEFVPNDKQSAFLESDDDVCMIAGGAGSGKSLVALINLLGLNDPDGPRYQKPYYRGLIYRKHYKDLRDLILKSKEIYKEVDPGAKFVGGNTLTWTFSSGAQIYFQHFERFDQAETFFQGQELSIIHCDEIGQYDSPDIMQYAMSRLRDSHGLRCYFRCSSNPSRYRWLRNYFNINDAGDSTYFVKEFTLDDGTIVLKHFRYIQAKLSDNPHISKEYQAQLMMMSTDDCNALLYGNWAAYDVVEGQVFEHELKAMKEERRYCNVPFDPAIPVNTFWDIGSSDMTVILFVQFVGKEVHIIDMIKDNNKGLNDYYMPEVMKRIDTCGYRYQKHHFPHDGGKREWTTNVKIIDQARKTTNDVMQLPRDGLAEGLQCARAMFRNVWINKAKCEDLFEDLVNYRREWKEDLGIWSDKPVHDNHSHAADAFRYVSYYKAPSAILDPTPYSSGSPFTYSGVR